MSTGEQRSVPEPGEQVYPPRSSWLPAFLAFAIALAVCGIYISILVPGWIYSLIAGVAALLIFRAMTRDAAGDFYRLRRKQKVRGAVLPVATISPPKR